MEATVLNRKRRVKKAIPAMLPVKKWLTIDEACSYMDLSINHFKKLAIENRLSLSFVAGKKYYRVSQLDGLIEKNILIK